MNRVETTKFLGNLLKRNRFSGMGKAGFYRTDNKYRCEKVCISSRCIYEVIGNSFDNPELLEGGHD